MDADMVRISSIFQSQLYSGSRYGNGGSIRQVRHRKEWVLVEDIALDEPLQ